MKRSYSRPVVEFEAYSLTTQIAGACSDAKKTLASDRDAVTFDTLSFHCYESRNWTKKNCSNSAHTFTVVGPTYAVFCDGPDDPKGCTKDIYSTADYDKIASDFKVVEGSTISGTGVATHKGQVYFPFKGSSDQHTGAVELPQYNTTFIS